MSFEDFVARGTQRPAWRSDAPRDRSGDRSARGTFSESQLLSILDAVIAGNPGFGDWVQDQLNAHPVVPDCTGLSYESCVDQLEARGLDVERHTLSETNLDAGTGEVVDTDPAADEHPSPERQCRSP